MTGRTKLPNPRRRGEPITLDWIKSNCAVEPRRIPMTDCWVWLGSKDQSGYGMVRSAEGCGPMRRTHRVAFELANGEIPDGMQLDHLCRTRDCCNPLHLDVVTLHENVLRGDRHKPWLTNCLQCGSSDVVYRRRGNGRNRECRDCHRARNRKRMAGIRAAARRELSVCG